MKKLILTLIVFFSVFTTLSFTQEFENVKLSKTEYHKIEKNYLKGLHSNNFHLKVSCAYFLGEMKSEKALFPLMKMFRNEKNDGAKLVAAWSLLKIGDPRGNFLVKRYLTLGNCNNIRCILYFLYENYHNAVNYNSVKIANNTTNGKH